MSSNAMTGQGTIFNRNEAPMAEINSISGPGMSRETIDVTVLATTSGYRRKIGSLRDAGSLSLNMNFTYATYALMKTDFEDEDPQDYEIVLPDGTSLAFKGLVTELPLDIPVGDKITADVTIEIDDTVTLTVASP